MVSSNMFNVQDYKIIYTYSLFGLSLSIVFNVKFIDLPLTCILGVLHCFVSISYSASFVNRVPGNVYTIERSSRIYVEYL